MRYPNKLYIELIKTPFNKKLGISNGQVQIMKNFAVTKVNISKRQDYPGSGIDYVMSSVEDYTDIVEIEFTRKDQL